MSGHRPLTNFGANRIVSDHRNYIDSEGVPIGYAQTVEEWQASSAVIEGQLVALQAATQTVPERVAPAGTSENARLIVGVALNQAAAGQVVRVCTSGICHVLVEAAATAARGNGVGNGGTTAGAAGVVAAPDATTVAGALIGVYLTAKLAAYTGEGSVAAQRDDYAVARIVRF